MDKLTEEYKRNTALCVINTNIAIIEGYIAEFQSILTIDELNGLGDEMRDYRQEFKKLILRRQR